MNNLRIGYGWDYHRLVEDRKLIIGGILIPYEKGLQGHSDADVLLHALADALLGAMGLPDIGQYFPPSDEKYKGMDSSLILKEVLRLTCEAGLESIINVDCVIIAQEPKLSGYIPAMKDKIAAVLNIGAGVVGIKATTTETMGSIGRKEGIAASAVCLVTRYE